MSIWTDFLILCAVWAATFLILAIAELRQQWQCRRYEHHIQTALKVADPSPSLHVIRGQR